MVESFKFNCRPGTVPAWTRAGERHVSAFVTIEYQGGKLSITGVEGPTSSGDAAGSCGQIDSTLRAHLDAGNFRPAEHWTPDMLRRLLDIWNEWHLNDMSAADAAMIRDGWREEAATPCYVWKFSLSSAAWEERRAAERAALDALAAGATFTPDARQSAVAALPLSYTAVTLDDVPPAPLADYERSKRITREGGLEPAERKTLGWIKPAEHPRGLLGKEHPESGNRYGCAWYRRDVPADILAELQALPLSDRPHPWRNA